MLKFAILAVIASLVAESSCQRPHIILPTYRPPPRQGPVIRTVREADRAEPKWLYQGDIPRAPATGDHPTLPKNIDDVRLDPNRRYARSLDSPSAKRGGGSHTTSSGSRNTGATHPGYNRRNTRSIKNSDLSSPGPVKFPSPGPVNPNPRPTFNPHTHPGKQILPINSRYTRDLNFPGMKKPSHRDVIIPNWNPHVKTNPWNRIKPQKY